MRQLIERWTLNKLTNIWQLYLVCVGGFWWCFTFRSKAEFCVYALQSSPHYACSCSAFKSTKDASDKSWKQELAFEDLTKRKNKCTTIEAVDKTQQIFTQSPQLTIVLNQTLYLFPHRKYMLLLYITEQWQVVQLRYGCVVTIDQIYRGTTHHQFLPICKVKFTGAVTLHLWCHFQPECVQ